jgi:hypothetical protein
MRGPFCFLHQSLKFLGTGLWFDQTERERERSKSSSRKHQNVLDTKFGGEEEEGRRYIVQSSPDSGGPLGLSNGRSQLLDLGRRREL